MKVITILKFKKILKININNKIKEIKNKMMKINLKNKTNLTKIIFQKKIVFQVNNKIKMQNKNILKKNFLIPAQVTHNIQIVIQIYCLMIKIQL